MRSSLLTGHDVIVYRTFTLLNDRRSRGDDLRLLLVSVRLRRQGGGEIGLCKEQIVSAIWRADKFICRATGLRCWVVVYTLGTRRGILLQNVSNIFLFLIQLDRHSVIVQVGVG